MEKKKENVRKLIYFNEDTCVCCGEVVPEGQMICAKCQQKLTAEKKNRRRIKFFLPFLLEYGINNYC